MGGCRHGMLEGNWVEEIALQEIGGAGGSLHAQAQTSFQRVLGQQSYPTVLSSTSADALSQAATLATRTKNAAYRYLKTERERAEIWKQAKEQYRVEMEVENVKEEEGLKEIYANTLLDKGRRPHQSDQDDKVEDLKQYSTIYSWDSDIHDGRSNQKGHGRQTSFTNPNPM